MSRNNNRINLPVAADVVDEAMVKIEVVADEVDEVVVVVAAVERT